MEIKRIVKDNEKSLREVSTPVATPFKSDDINNCLYLYNHLVFASDEENAKKYDLRPGVGLAAPQVGINKRMLAVYITYPDAEPTSFALINPKIISHSDRKAYLLGGEGCLSVDNPHQGYVIRYAFITVNGYDCITNKEITIKLRGYEAIVMQHELDHLDGILFYDRIDKKNPFKRIEGALEI